MNNSNQDLDLNQIKILSFKINKTVFKLGLISFFADISSEMLYPITPIFLTTVLGASMMHLGLIEGAAEATASLLKTYSGVWSDKVQIRKPFILLGYFLSALAKPMIGFSNGVFGVLSARFMDRVGKGVRTAPRDALLSDSVSEDQLGAAFGWHRAMDSFGAALGPLLALLFLSLNSNQLRDIYFWAFIPGLLSIIVIFTVSEKRKSELQINSKWQSPFKSFSKTSMEFKRYLLAWGVFSLANSSDVFLLMKVKDSGFTIQTVILLYIGYNLIYSFLSPVFGKISDKFPRKNILILGLLIFTGVYLGFGFAQELWQFIILFLIYGIYMGATDGVGKAYAVDLSDKKSKATHLGVLGTVTGLTTIFASGFAGFLWDHVGSSWTFFFGAIGASLSIIMFLGIKSASSNLSS